MQSKSATLKTSSSLSALLSRIDQEIERRLTDDQKESLAKRLKDSKTRCKCLSGFVREAWHVLEPVAVYVHNWHIDTLCDHLEAVTRGEINRLLVNIPPGSMKSLIVSVFWPAWEWAMGHTSYRYITTSFSEDATKRDNRKMRDLILSAWYQDRFQHVVLTRKGETSFANSATGYRESSPFGSLTSKRGDRLIIDDPHSIETAESDNERASTTRRFREGALNRLNDQAKSAIVVIMQRLHERDISGVILDLFGDQYVHVMLPMEFEKSRRCYTEVEPTEWEAGDPRQGRYDAEKNTWYFANDNVPAARAEAVEKSPVRLVYSQDPRTKDGELLDPVRFPPKEVKKLSDGMGSHAFAGQYQQRPSARGGGMFRRHWFKIVDALPARVIKTVRSWDLASSIEAPGIDPDYTASVKMSECRAAEDPALKNDGDDRKQFYVEDVQRMREGPAVVRRAIKNTASQDGRRCHIRIPQDPGQAGKDQSQSIISSLAGYRVTADRETGDKGTRAEPFAAQCEAGNVFLLRGEWNEGFIDEMCAFPQGHDDRFDAASGAFNKLADVRGPLRISAEILERSRQKAGR